MICDWPFLLQGLREVKGKAISGCPAEINVICYFFDIIFKSVTIYKREFSLGLK